MILTRSDSSDDRSDMHATYWRMSSDGASGFLFPLLPNDGTKRATELCLLYGSPRQGGAPVKSVVRKVSVKYPECIEPCREPQRGQTLISGQPCRRENIKLATTVGASITSMNSVSGCPIVWPISLSFG
jgi:hypothetical protein